MVRCVTCKGLGKVNGIGGIQRDCSVCDGVGKIEAPAAAIVQAVDTSVKDVEITPKIVHEVKKKEVEAEEILDELTQASLDEPKMTADQWQAKYPAIAAISDTRQRHETRVLYASRKPAAPRKVNLNVMQDDVARKDADYLAYEAKENARLEAETRRKEGLKK